MTKPKRRITAETLRARGYLTAAEVHEELQRRGRRLPPRGLWHLLRQGVIRPPVLAGEDKLRRRVSWYAPGTVERVLLAPPPKIRRRRSQTYQEVLQGEFMRGIIAYMRGLPEEKQVLLEADAIADRFRAFEDARASRGEWAPPPPSAHTPSEDGLHRVMFLERFRERIAAQTPEDVAKRPVTEEEKVIALWKRMSPEERGFAAGELFLVEFARESMKWKNSGVGSAIFLLREAVEARDALTRGERGRAYFLLARVAVFVPMVVRTLTRDFGPDQGLDAEPAETLAPSKPESVQARQAESRTASP